MRGRVSGFFECQVKVFLTEVIVFIFSDKHFILFDNNQNNILLYFPFD
jgi:hypothetical protein